MNERSFKVGDLKRFIAESSTEFKPILGKGVEADNKKNNDKSYKDSKERTEKYDKKGKKKEEKELAPKEDYNRTMLDYNPRTEPTQEYKDRVKAQALGYTSTLEMNNGLEKAADFEGNKKIYKQFTDASKKIEDERAKLAHSGLQARMKDKSEFTEKHLYENAPKPKRLIFKHTKFYNENQVITRIPEQYINEGQIIEMCDKVGNKYVVECVRSEKSGLIETNIISHSNKQEMNEQLARISQLFAFESDTNGRINKVNRIDENTEMKNILDTMRGTK